MGMMAYARGRAYVYGWRLRHWWMDTRNGRRAHVYALCLCVLVVVAQLVRLAVAALLPPPPGAPVHAVYWWVVQLIIMVVAAVVAYALRPDPPQPQERQLESPTVQDGTAAKDCGGTVWLEYDENFLLYHEVVGRDPIYSDGGKK